MGKRYLCGRCGSGNRLKRPIQVDIDPDWLDGVVYRLDWILMSRTGVQNTAWDQVLG